MISTARSLARRLAAGVLVTAAAGALALGGASPAAAETLNGSCESGELCLYYSTNYTGAIADMYDAVPDYTGWHFYASSSWLNDNTWSGKSRTVFAVACVSENANYGGKMFFRAMDQQGSTDFGAYRDKASSHRFLAGCSYN
jgi:hypothetical protein